MSRVIALLCAVLLCFLLAPSALAQLCAWEGALPRVDPEQIRSPDGMHEAMCNAYAIADPVDRETAMREVLETYLLVDDIKVVNLALNYLGRNQRWLDLTPFSDVFAALAEKPGRMNEDVDGYPMWSYLRRAPMSERIALCREALVSGAAKVSSWSRPFARENALQMAALDGLDELRDEIRKAHATSVPYFRKHNSLEYLLMTLDQRAGATDRVDAAKRAAQRFEETDAKELRERMAEDVTLARVLDETAKEVCAINPYDGSQPPGCESILEVYVRQMAMVAVDKTGSAASSERGFEVMESAPAWLQKLGVNRIGDQPFNMEFVDRCRGSSSWDLEKCTGDQADQRE
jgi:hypothetical protein